MFNHVFQPVLLQDFIYSNGFAGYIENHIDPDQPADQNVHCFQKWIYQA